MLISKSLHGFTVAAALALAVYADPSRAAEECFFDIPTPDSGRLCGTGADSARGRAQDRFDDGTEFTYGVSFIAGTDVATAIIVDKDNKSVIDRDGFPCGVADRTDDDDFIEATCKFRFIDQGVAIAVRVD